MIPERCIILVCGIPATGKSAFGRYLSEVHAFAHYDLERYPGGWLRPELKPTWDLSREQFVSALKAHHKRVVLDWGFPPQCVPWVSELLASGARVVWFTGDAARAREVFRSRGGIAVGAFDAQVDAIARAGLPDTLKCIVVNVLTSDGVFLGSRDIEKAVFP